MQREFDYVVDAKHALHGRLHLDAHRLVASTAELGAKLLRSVLEESGYTDVEVRPITPTTRAD